MLFLSLVPSPRIPCIRRNICLACNLFKILRFPLINTGAAGELELMTDNQLMNLVKQGQTSHAGELYDRYKDPLYGFFFNLVQNKALSEDLVHNVFIRVLRYRDRFRGTGEFRHWIFAIARNIHADHYRQARRMNPELLDEVGDQFTSFPDAQKDLEHSEEIELLRKALGKLPPDKREIIVLSRLNGLKYSEIASIMEISEGNVKVRMFRAMRELRQIYHQQMNS